MATKDWEDILEKLRIRIEAVTKVSVTFVDCMCGGRCSGVTDWKEKLIYTYRAALKPEYMNHPRSEWVRRLDGALQYYETKKD